MNALRVVCLVSFVALVTIRTAAAGTMFNVEGSGLAVFNTLSLSGTIDIDTALGVIEGGSMTVSGAGAFDGTYNVLTDQGFDTSPNETTYFSDFTGSLLRGDNLDISIFLGSAPSLVGDYSALVLCGPLELYISCDRASYVSNGLTGVPFEGILTSTAVPEPKSFLLMGMPAAWAMRRRLKGNFSE